VSGTTKLGGGGLFDIGRYTSLLKFAVVGGVGIVVNEGLLIALQRTGMYYLLAGAIAIEISILSNFALNDFWTFRDRRSGKMVTRLTRFNFLMLAGLAVNLAVLDLGTSYLGLASTVSNLIGIAVAFVLRYALSVKYAWMRTEEIETGESAASRPL
jgi:dolichol-phosphate mannosyltransferase